MVLLFVRKSILSNNYIAIIDYKMGNLRSVQKAFEKVGANAIITNDKELIEKSSKIVLPGVGAFSDGMKNLRELKLIPLLKQEVIQRKKPFLGICLGMQLLAQKSFEKQETQGLAWVDAEVVKFDFNDKEKQLKVPHVGWNNISFKNNSKLFTDISDSSDFYFVHSYHFRTKEDIITSTTNYGFDFISSIQKNNIYATQFHPEKSQTVGLQMIKNFINLPSDIKC